MTPRYFKNDQEAAPRDAGRQLEASLTRLIRDHPPSSITPGGGLYRGPVSVAYTLMVLQQLYPDLVIEDHPLGTWSAAYLKYAQENIASYRGPAIGRCGITDDIMALLAIGAASSKDAEMAADLCDYATEAIDPNSGNEMCYGRAGYLYLLRLIKASFADDPKTLQLITDTQEDVIDAIFDSPRPWKWHNKLYVGAIHGTIGIITQIVLTNPQRWAPRLEAELAVVLSCQYPESGNFPSTLPVTEKDRLVQVCHGASGIIISLNSIKEYFPNLRDKIDRAISRGRKCIIERGLLTKEPCICHGISGNALALEDEQLRHFLSYTTGNEMKALEKDGLFEKSSAPESLMEGEAGRAWCWAIADKRLDKRILGYNDL